MVCSHRTVVGEIRRSGDAGGKGNKSDIQTEVEEGEQQAKRRGMSWAQRLKRVFGIDIEVCPHCGDGVRIIACIEDPVVIRQILSHVETKQEPERAVRAGLASKQTGQ